MGVILYVLYQGEYPFSGFSDEDIFHDIASKPNYWKPEWKEGISQQARNFIALLLDPAPHTKEKALLLNDPYIT